MFQLINVSINFGRLNKYSRTHLFESGSKLRLSWGAISDHTDAYQTACHATLTGKSFTWDSGWVIQSEQTLLCEAAIPEGIELLMTIQIRDNYGVESEIFTDTIYNASVTWNAKWIRSAVDDKGKTVYLRREFTIAHPIQSAILYACGIGYHKLFINGKEIDSAVLDPAVTDYSKTCQYVTYTDCQQFFSEGINCIGALVGNGWRRNTLIDPDDNGDKKPYAGCPLFTAMLRLTYRDGSEEWLYSDEQWQYGYGAHVSNDIFDGELYNANLSSKGWNSPGYKGFSYAVISEGPCGLMRPMILSPIKEHRCLPVISSWPIDTNAFIVDFGQNIAGVVRIRFPRLRQDQMVRISTSEELNEDGSLFTDPLRKAKSCDIYIASGDDRDLEYWQPIFTYHGFRYARIDGLGSVFDPDRIQAVELHTDLETNSFFRCGDALVTRIHEACVATERANQHSILTDCPQRDERQGWLNDATVRFQETPYNFDVGRMFPKVIRDIIDVQGLDGSITCTAPYVFGFRPADPVCSSFLVAGLEACMHTGNRDILEEAFDSFASWENCLLDNSEGYIVNYGHYGDWAGPAYACVRNSIGDGAESEVTPLLFMSTGYSYLNCMLLSTLAEMIEKTNVASYWHEMANKVREAMLSKWYDSETGKICTASQGCQAFALWLGIIPQADTDKAAKIIHDDLVSRNYQFTTGNLCTRYIMDVLADHKYLEDAWKLITKQTYPSIGFMLQQEATTIWERFELKKDPGMNSHNHPMYASVDYWFYAYLCGIRPVKPGYEEFIVKPVFPDELMSAQAVVDTVKGDIAVRWIKRYGKLHLHLTVPFGTKANVYFNKMIVKVGSGFHTFSVPLE